MSKKQNAHTMLVAPLFGVLALALSACASGTVSAPVASTASVAQLSLNVSSLVSAPHTTVAVNDDSFIGQTPWMTIDP